MSSEQSAQNEVAGEEDHDRDRGGAEETGLKRRLWVETKKLWHLVGPTILSRICAATFAVVTQAFAGHLGDVELASISIVNTVILGFSFGLVNISPDDWTFKELHISFGCPTGVHECECLGNDDSYFFLRSNRNMHVYSIYNTVVVNRVRVANELGAGNGKGAKFATKVSVGQSLSIGILFSLLIILFPHKIAMIFSSSHDVIQAVGKLSYLLALTILFNSVQPVLSGVAVGSGWQSWVAYINIGCYYLIGIPVGLFLGRFFNFGVKGIWGGMIFGTAVQTTILGVITILCDWEKEAQKAVLRVKHLSSPNPDDDHLMVEN
ncbi:hypothetical protein RHSIM_Rhsim06G0075800 [Rhododendron simsii]|uniref:Uncharacterized protein n=1 Tax=Rhododendron simsii TaxID=118357 RepID=A0A834GVC6_RHOSS|nr:hypothetical protein RHSIM_Rhsim06G0075800 [Rhododendron simsii]